MPAVVHGSLIDCAELCNPSNGYPYSCNEKCPGYEVPPSPENVDLEPPSSKSYINEAIIPSVGLMCLIGLLVLCYVYRDILLNVTRATVNGMTSLASSVISSLNNVSLHEVLNSSDNVVNQDNVHIVNVDDDVGRRLLETVKDSTDLKYPVQETLEQAGEIDEHSEAVGSF